MGLGLSCRVTSQVTQAMFVRVVVVKIPIIMNLVEMVENVENALYCENILMKTRCLCHTMHCG